MTPEKKVQNEIMSYLKNLKVPTYVERRQAGGFSYKTGLPDLFAVIRGIHFEIEVKRPGGKLRATQEKWKQRFEEVGAKHIVAESVDDVRKIVNKFLGEE